MPHRRDKAEPLSLILAPTHELATEINETLLGLCDIEYIRCVLVYGGPPSSCRMQQLSAGCDVWIQRQGDLDPSRIAQFLIEKKAFSALQPIASLAHLQSVIDDEAEGADVAKRPPDDLVFDNIQAEAPLRMRSTRFEACVPASHEKKERKKERKKKKTSVTGFSPPRYTYTEDQAEGALQSMVRE